MTQPQFTLYGKQLEIMQDWLTTDKNCMDIIHAGAGKSHMAALALPLFCMDERYHKGKDVILISPTTDMIKTNIWDMLKATCLEHYGIKPEQINNTDLTIRFPNCVLRCKSAEIRDRLRGMNAGIILCDEASLFTQEVLQELLNRLRPRVGSNDSPGRMIIISTPKGDGPLKELFEYATANPQRWIVRHYNYMEMRSGNLEFILEQKRLLSPLKFAQDYEVSWTQVENQFYYSWNNRYIGATVDRGGDLYVGFDFNKRLMNSVVAQVANPYKTNGSIEILRSYSIPDCSTEQMASAIRSDYNQREIYAVIDMSGTQVNRDTTSPFGVTDRTILEKYGFQIINTKKGNPLIADTDNSSNAFIARGGLRVPPQETKLLQALNTYHYEDGQRKKLVKYSEKQYAHLDGLGDALRYLIHHLFPLQHVQPNIPDYVTNDPRLGSVPGSQYRKQGAFGPGTPTIEELINQNTQHTEDHMIW